MKRDEFARAVHARLPKKCPGNREAILEALFLGGAAEVILTLPKAEVAETEKAVRHSGSADNGRESQT